jgi:hypothetical protein
MNIDMKAILPLLLILVSVGATWGNFTQKIEALEIKVDKVEQMAIDIAIVKEKIGNIERYLIKE